MKVKRKTTCRGRGKVFSKIKLSDVQGRLRVFGRASDISIPVALQRIGTSFKGEDHVLSFPYLDDKDIDIVIEDDHGKCSLKYDCRVIKVTSILNYRIRRKECIKLCDSEDVVLDRSFQVRILRFLEGDDRNIWRIDVRWIGVCATEPKIQTYDASGNPVEQKIYLFEKNSRELIDDDAVEFTYVYSIALPTDLVSCYIVVADPREEIGSGFCALDRRFVANKMEQTRSFMSCASDDAALYNRWFALHKVTSDELTLQTKRSSLRSGSISVIVDVDDMFTDHLERTLISIGAQSFKNFEIIILASDAADLSRSEEIIDRFERAVVVCRYPEEDRISRIGRSLDRCSGDYITFISGGDVLEPDAFACSIERFGSDPDVDIVYSDEDFFHEEGNYLDPQFKGIVNEGFLYSSCCNEHLLMMKSGMIELLCSEPLISSDAYSYELILRALDRGLLFGHIPRILYHNDLAHLDVDGGFSGHSIHMTENTFEEGKAVLRRYFANKEIGCEVIDSDAPGLYKLEFDRCDTPLVSIIIPNKDHVEDLSICINSIIDRATYPNYEIVIVENNSTEQETFEYYESLTAHHRNVEVVRWPDVFNYSGIINFGASHAKGEFFLLLNNDTEVIEPRFIEEMLGFASLPNVGVVGAKLFFRDGLVQHAGIEVGPYDAIVHVNQDFVEDRAGYRGTAIRTWSCSAVTGACQMVRKDVFNDVRGYDVAFAVGFNDADFCLRVIEKGYKVIYTPHSKLHHYEFTSRGRDESDPARYARWKDERSLMHKRWRKYFVEGDPYSNPNLKRNSAYFALPDPLSKE